MTGQDLVDAASMVAAIIVYLAAASALSAALIHLLIRWPRQTAVGCAVFLVLAAAVLDRWPAAQAAGGAGALCYLWLATCG